ncbi:hypothetical protein L208DRAFT_1318932, partial [Tricholoma matsutake]
SQCPCCVPVVELPSLGPGVLAHMAAHFNFDSRTNAASEPCGLCLQLSPHCIFRLKKGKGANSGVQIDYEKSTCANLFTFSYSVAPSSTSSSPCSNVPILCPWCLKSEPAVWQYNMPHHVKSKHSHVSLRENEDMWKIGNSEKQELKKIWDQCHKIKKTQKGKKSSMPSLIISAVHSSHYMLW